MKEWITGRITDIRTKTKGMNPGERREYIIHYYWHYFLLAGIALGLSILLAYHIFFGQRTVLFQCVAVNQEINYQRDRRVSADFASWLGVGEKRVVFDCDYNISYGDVLLPETNESSYEKFFLNWSVHELDAVIMPESFYQYCLRQGGEFARVIPITDEETAERLGLIIDESDPLLLGLPSDSRHLDMGERFIEFVGLSQLSI